MRRTTIRAATPRDAGAISEMVVELATFLDLRAPVALSEEALRSLLAPPAPAFDALVAERDGRVLGYASFQTQFWIWDAAKYIALDDLFVRQEARGQGLGRELLLAVGRLALARGQKVRWDVAASNPAAQEFYLRLGATLSEKKGCRWEPAAIAEALG